MSGSFGDWGLDAMSQCCSGQRYIVSFDADALSSCRTDTLVIGACVSGLRAAMAAAAHGRVPVLASDGSQGANTWWPQGGAAAPVSPGDSVDQHLADTLPTGAGLCDPVAARFIIERGPRRLEELIEWGLGCHFRTDAPTPDPTFATHDTWVPTTDARPAPTAHDDRHLHEAIEFNRPDPRRALPRAINGISR